MPPADEIARAIGATPVNVIGTALMRDASSPADMLASDAPDVFAASCSSPIATGDNPAALRKKFDNDCLPFGADSFFVRSSVARSGQSLTINVACLARRIASRSSAESV